MSKETDSMGRVGVASLLFAALTGLYLLAGGAWLLAPGDRTAPTQPFSELTFRPDKPLAGADMWGATIYDQLVCRIIFHRLRYEGIFTPSSTQGTLVFPGNLGMFEWGGLAVDTDRKIAIANPIALPFVSTLVPRGPDNPVSRSRAPRAAAPNWGCRRNTGCRSA